MTTRPLRLTSVASAAIVIVLLAAGAVAAQGVIPGPRGCGDCDPPEKRLKALEDERAEIVARLNANKARIAELQKEIETARAALAEGKATGFADAERMRELEVRIEVNGWMIEGIRDREISDNTRLNEIDVLLIPRERVALQRCRSACGSSPEDPPVTGGNPPPETTGGVTPPPKCEPCETPAEEATRLSEERRQLDDEIARLDREIRDLEAANARDGRAIEEIKQAGKDPKYAGQQHIINKMVDEAALRMDATNRLLKAKRGARDGAARRRGEIDQRLPELRDQVNKCNASCTLPGNTKWYLIGGGATAAGLLAGLAGGGSSPAVLPPSAPAPVAATPQPPAQPQPPAGPQPPSEPQPPTDPFESLEGTSDCLNCMVTNDPLRHDLVLRACDQAGGAWDIGIASITIRHPSFAIPERMPLDASGNFRGEAVTTAAGRSNVRVATEGTADPAAGRIRFLYTIGVGGELPGGLPITYSITLQKRR